MLTVNRELFAEWILEDAEDFYALKNTLIDCLKNNGSITLDDLFKSCGYIPSNLIIEEVGDQEFTPLIDCILEEDLNEIPRKRKQLEGIEDFIIFQHLKEVRHKTFISWSIDDVKGKAEELGFVMGDEKAIDIISEIERRADCTVGITWETIEYYVEEWIEENSFEVEITDCQNDKTVMFCSLTTNENIEEYWKDGMYYFYGASADDLVKGEYFEPADCIIVDF